MGIFQSLKSDFQVILFSRAPSAGKFSEGTTSSHFQPQVGLAAGKEPKADLDLETGSIVVSVPRPGFSKHTGLISKDKEFHCRIW